jgi:hypothetical protein
MVMGGLALTARWRGNAPKLELGGAGSADWLTSMQCRGQGELGVGGPSLTNYTKWLRWPWRQGKRERIGQHLGHLRLSLSSP